MAETKEIEPGKTYILDTMTRWGCVFRVKKITERNVVCGGFVFQNRLKQMACFHMDEFIKYNPKEK